MRAKTAQSGAFILLLITFLIQLATVAVANAQGTEEIDFDAILRSSEYKETDARSFRLAPGDPPPLLDPPPLVDPPPAESAPPTVDPFLSEPPPIVWSTSLPGVRPADRRSRHRPTPARAAEPTVRAPRPKERVAELTNRAAELTLPQPVKTQENAQSHRSRDNSPVESKVHSPVESTVQRTVTALPVLGIETDGPRSINVGAKAKYTITFRNRCTASAHGVAVTTTLPEDVRLVQAPPQPDTRNLNNLRFQVGDIPPQGRQQLTITILPQRRGSVVLDTVVNLRSTSTTLVEIQQPKIKVTCSGPAEGLNGDSVDFELTVTNEGNGTAENVRIQQILPGDALTNGKGTDPILVGSLPAGDSRKVLVTLTAHQGGQHRLEFIASAIGAEESRASADVTIRQADLEIRSRGPRLAYVNRVGVYEFEVTNVGDAAARDVVVQTTLPAGVTLLAVDRKAVYADNRTKLNWTVATIAPGASEGFRLKVNAETEGQQLFRIVATGPRKLRAAAEHVTGIISRADLHLAVDGSDGPTEVGGIANISVLVSNNGSKQANGVTVAVRLGDDLEAVRSEEGADVDGQLAFGPFDLPAGEQRRVGFQAIGWASGDHLVRVEIRAEGDSGPIVLEERAFFYDSSVDQARLVKDMELRR